MQITKALDRDCKCLRSYFHKKFELMQLAFDEERSAPIVIEDADADESQAVYHEFSHFILPDMVINTYSLLEWWLRKICDVQKVRKGLDKHCENLKREKSESDIDKYHRYLTQYAQIDLDKVENSRIKLDSLRRVRNRFIHHGGDIPSNDIDKYSCIDGICVISLSSSISYLSIENDFIWDMLDHVQKYLYQAVIP